MDDFDAVIPRTREYEIISFDGDFGGTHSIFSAKLRVNVSSSDDIKEWISELGESLRCNFILADTKRPKKAVLYRKYFCHLNKCNKSTRVARRSSTPNLRLRNYDCDASISIWIYSGDDYALKNLAGEVVINWEHSHDVETAHFLSLLRASKATKRKFLEYFDSGLSAAEAITNHKTTFDGDACNEKDRASQAYNPSRRTISYWYETWRDSNFGQRLCSYDALKNKLSDYVNSGVILLLNENPFAVLVVTPIMQRVHRLHSASEICFVDSTATCDVENHSITFMLAKTCIGAAPLAMFITIDQTEDSYSTAFGLLKKALGLSAFGGRGSPSVFITDDSVAEKKGLASVWPDSDLKNCVFHMAQAHWRWLWVPNNLISMEHRQQMMMDFRAIMFSSTDMDADAAFQIAIARYGNDYPNYVTRLQGLWDRRIDWVIAYRDYTSRGNFTNNLAEITVRLFKEIVLGRSKAYNAAALVDFVCNDAEAYYRNRLLDFAECRSNAAYLLMEEKLEKAAYIPSAESITVQPDGSYLVPSDGGDGEHYLVNATLGYCSCRNGQFGKFCKHAAAVFKFYPQALPNLPPVSMNDRHEMATVALGDRARDREFYKAMNEDEDAGPSGIGEITKDDSSAMDLQNAGKIYESAIRISTVKATLQKREIDEKEIKDTMEILGNCLIKYRQRANVAAAFKRFSTQLSGCINAPSRLASLLCSTSQSFGSKVGSKIRINPASVARRTGIMTHGSGRMPAGRSANALATKLVKRARERRKHDLGAAVASGRPNATAHNVKSK